MLQDEPTFRVAPGHSLAGRRLRFWISWPIMLAVGIGLLSVWLGVMLPHWAQKQGKITSKEFWPAWVEHHPQRIEHHSSHDYTWTEKVGKTIIVHHNYQPAYDELHAAWDENHAPQYKLMLDSAEAVWVGPDVYEQAVVGDRWKAVGFYTSTLVKAPKPEAE